MPKLVLDNIVNLQNEGSATNKMNANGARIVEAIENTLSRDGTSPNQMRANLDMNGKRILNLGPPTTDAEPVRLGDLGSDTVEIAQSFLDQMEAFADDATTALQDHIDDTTAAHAASAVSFSPAGGIAATNVQTAIAELDTEKLAASSYTAADVLTKVLTVDGAGSGLDADLLDGNSSAFFAPASVSGTAAAILASLLTVDGAGSGLDADLLDGNSSAAFATAAHTHTSANITDFQEATEDTVGTLLTGSESTGDLDWTYTDGSGTLNAAVKGDAITYAKMQNVSGQYRVLGRWSSGAGDVEELNISASTSYSPVVTASGGTLTGHTITTTGAYMRIGALLFWGARLTFTSVGSGSPTGVQVSLPVTPAASAAGYGSEAAVFGGTMRCFFAAGDNNAYVARYDGANAFVNSYVIYLGGFYFV